MNASNGSGMKILRLELAALVPDVANMRTHSEQNIAAIMSSLKRWGQQKPIVIDAHNVIRCGNGTYTAANKLGWTHIDCVVSELTGAELAAFAVADNRTAEMAGWSEELGPFLSKLKVELPDLDTSGLGFDVLLPSLPPEIGKEVPVVVDDAQEQRAQELLKKWGTSAGQLWTLGRHRLLCDDCTVEANVLRVCNGVVPNLMVTDQPYGDSYDPAWRDNDLNDSNGGRATMRVAEDDKVDWSAAWKLFKGNIAYVWFSAIHCNVVQTALESVGFEIRNQIVWAKTHFAISRGHYHWQHEPCFYAVRSGKTADWRGPRDQTTLWTIEKPYKNESGHSTQKPLECMFRPIRNHDSDYVYDPFVGSGTTILAAEQLGRTCLALDKDPLAIAIALERWNVVTGIKPVLST